MSNNRLVVVTTRGVPLTDTAADSDASNKASPVEGESLNWISLAGLVDR